MFTVSSPMPPPPPPMAMLVFSVAVLDPVAGGVVGGVAGRIHAE